MMSQGRSAVDTLLAESLKELSKKHPIEKITIKEITDGAGVIRPTFYNHFQDKYELLEWIIMKELLEPMRPLIENGMAAQAMVLFFSSIEHEKEFYIRASRLEGQNSFEFLLRQSIQKVLFRILEDHMPALRPDYPWIDRELIFEYHAQSICFLVLHWIGHDMDISAKEMADTYHYMLGRSFEDMLKGIED